MPPPRSLSKLRVEWWPRQEQAFNVKATEILFGGASEGGKSHFGRYATACWCACVPNLQIRIFRKHYADVVGNHMDGPSSYPEILRPWIRDKFVKTTENEVQFANGALIQLAGMLHKKDLEKHQGLEKHVLWIEESTQIPWAFIQGLAGWLRMPEEMIKELPNHLRSIYPTWSDEELKTLRFPLLLLTTNPLGVSAGAHKRAFLEHKPFEPHKAPDREGGRVRVFIPAKITDNPSADPVKQRERLLPMGEKVAQAYIEGLWDSIGGDFYPEFRHDLHIVDNFTPPSHWFKFRTFDWGSNDPFAVYWFAVSDGEAFQENGKAFWYPSGALIAYREWYGCKEDDPAKGIHLGNNLIAKGIVERTQEATSGLTFSDNFPFADRGSRKNGTLYTMADEFMEHGCPLTLGNTARVYGWKQLRQRLIGIEGVPMIYFQRSCIYAATYLPALGHHPSEGRPEDAEEHGEATHASDAIRLGCTLKPMIVTAPEEPAELPSYDKVTPNSIIKQISKQMGPKYVTRW